MMGGFHKYFLIDSAISKLFHDEMEMELLLLTTITIMYQKYYSTQNLLNMNSRYEYKTNNVSLS